MNYCETYIDGAKIALVLVVKRDWRDGTGASFIKTVSFRRL